jgi:uncharacterized membrane protein YgaE (UPF0421/DUF939 family)
MPLLLVESSAEAAMELVKLAPARAKALEEDRLPQMTSAMGGRCCLFSALLSEPWDLQCHLVMSLTASRGCSRCLLLGFHLVVQ